MFYLWFRANHLVRSWYVSQANQGGYEKGGGTINYIV